jgi:uroporphyrinogen-III synthase
LLDDRAKRRLGAAVRVVAISPVTSAAARESGIGVNAEATEYTTEGIVTALLRDREEVKRGRG